MKFYWRKPYENSTYYLRDGEVKGAGKISTITFSPFNNKTEKTFTLKGSYQRFDSNNFSNEFNQNVLLRLNVDSGRYQEFLKDSIDLCKKGGLQKVIASRVITLEGVLNYEQLFMLLIKEYPDCLVYLFVVEDEVFIGATPELLLSSEKRKVCSVALAGTMKVPDGLNLYSWKSKELHEQQLVEDYIKENFNNFCNGVTVSKKSIKINGPVCHLHSEIQGKLNSDSTSEALMSSIHPTPAVCGLPKNKAFDYIQSNEGYERRYYCGNIGIVDEQKEDYYVNLRCLTYKKGLTKIYVGGGITSDSDCLLEFQETELKSKVLLDIVSKIHRVESDNK